MIIKLSLTTVIFNFFIFLIILETHPNFSLLFTSYSFIGFDTISLWLIWLMKLILPILILMEVNNINLLRLKMKLILGWLISIVFFLTNIILFYIFYEIILIPMFILITYYGSRNRKTLALKYLIMYTLIGSLALLLSFIIMYIITGSLNIEIISKFNFSKNQEIILGFFTFFAFSIKIPMIPLHLWLPEAHVEASTDISVILAAIILKIGVYGIIRFSLLFREFWLISTNIIIILALLGLIYSSFISLILWDIKKIIAYSSISHMNLLLIGLISNNLYGLNISVLFMISHGLISSGLFILIGMLYDRYKSRIIYYYRGLTLFLPLYSLILGFFTFANVGIPLTSSFISEFLILLSISKVNLGIFYISILTIILSPMWGLYIYQKIVFGKISNHLLPTLDINLKEINILIPLIFFTILLGIYPNIILDNNLLTVYKYLY